MVLPGKSRYTLMSKVIGGLGFLKLYSEPQKVGT